MLPGRPLSDSYRRVSRKLAQSSCMVWQVSGGGGTFPLASVITCWQLICNSTVTCAGSRHARRPSVRTTNRRITVSSYFFSGCGGQLGSPGMHVGGGGGG